MTIIDYLLVRDGRLEVLFFTLLYLTLSVPVGAVFRRNLPEALFMGFLVVAASSNLGLFVFRALALDLSWFAGATAALSLSIAGILRLLINTKGCFDFRVTPLYALAVLPLAAAIWFSQILMTEPAAGMSSHQAWYPLYLTESFKQGYFLTHDDMRFAPGFIASYLFNVDLLGLAALGSWFGAEAGYAPFLAAAIAAGMACVVILAHGLRHAPLALIGFTAFFLVYFRLDPDFRLVIGANWGDVLMYTSGAGIVYYLMAGGAERDSGHEHYALAAIAALMLPFGRSYGVFYAFVICAICLALHWRRRGVLDWRLWSGVFVLGCVFSAREIYMLLNQVSPYYDTGAYLFKFAATQWRGLIHNFGIDLADHRSFTGKALYGLYLAVAVAGVGPYILKIRTHRIPAEILLAPFALVFAPTALVILTSTHGGLGYSKLFAVAIFIHVYYPWRILAVSGLDRNLAVVLVKYRLPVASALVAVLIGGTIFSTEKIRNHRLIRNGIGPTLDWAFETYRLNNVDLLVARELTKRPELLSVLKTQPVLYFHYEPGITLRYFAGGKFFSDLDFWSTEVFETMDESRNFKDLIERLGDPVIYISHSTGFGYAGFDPQGRWKRFSDEILGLGQANWIADVISIAGARLYFPKGALK